MTRRRFKDSTLAIIVPVLIPRGCGVAGVAKRTHRVEFASMEFSFNQLILIGGIVTNTVIVTLAFSRLRTTITLVTDQLAELKRVSEKRLNDHAERLRALEQAHPIGRKS